MDFLEPLWMTDDELIGVTGAKRISRQQQWLLDNGFLCKVRADGSLLVSRRHFESIMGGLIEKIGLSYPEPDFDAI